MHLLIWGKKNNKSVSKEKKKSRATKSVSQHIILRHLFFSLHDRAKHVPPREVGTQKKGPTCSMTPWLEISHLPPKNPRFPIGTTSHGDLIGWFEWSPANHMLLDNIHWALLCPVTPQFCRGIFRKPPWLVSINSLLCIHDASRTLHSRYHIITDHNINDKETCVEKKSEEPLLSDVKQTSTYSHQLAHQKKQGTHTSQDSHVPLDSLESKPTTIDFGASPDCFTSVLRQSITWLEQVSNHHKSANPYLEPKWPLFLKVNPSKQGLFKPKEGSFGFQVYNIYSFFSMGWRCG